MIVSLATYGVESSNDELTEATDVAIFASPDLVLVHLYHLRWETNFVKWTCHANKNPII
jgi:hypothetical protein